jgi:multiple antibiotic resistance protein
MTSLDEVLLQNFALAMLAIVNPFGKVPVWVKASEGCDRAVRIRLAALVASTALAILLVFLLAGRYVLDFLGLDVPAVQVGGGIIILLTGIEMLRGKELDFDGGEGETGSGAFDQAKSRFRRIVVPFAVPILAGPGSIITATLFGFRSTDYLERAMLSGLLVAIMLGVFGILLAGRHIQAALGDLVLNVQSRIWGLLLTAIAAQMILVCLADAFPAWIDARSPMVDDVHEQTESTRPGT